MPGAGDFLFSAMLRFDSRIKQCKNTFDPKQTARIEDRDPGREVQPASYIKPQLQTRETAKLNYCR